MKDAANYVFSHRQVRLILPHRPPMLLVDCVTKCAYSLDTLEASRLISAGDPMLVRGLARRPYFPPALIVEALAQCCGLLMNLRWLTEKGIDVAAFANGDEGEVSAIRIPHSVLAETRMRQFRMVQAGECLHMSARVTLQRGQMFRFAAAASCRAATCTELDVLLAFPEYTAVPATADAAASGDAS